MEAQAFSASAHTGYAAMLDMVFGGLPLADDYLVGFFFSCPLAVQGKLAGDTCRTKRMDAMACMVSFAGYDGIGDGQ